MNDPDPPLQLPPSPLTQEQQYQQAQAQWQWMQQQQYQQVWWAQQQRLEAQRAWLASSQPVGTLLAIGMFALAAFHFVMMPALWGGSSFMFELVIRAPMVGAGLGGTLMAIGWFHVLLRRPRGAQQVVAVAGLLAGAGLAASGGLGLMSHDLFAALTSRSMAWLELGVTALALVGATMWRPGPAPQSAIIGWFGFACMVLFAVLSTTFAGGLLGIVTIGTWCVAGTATLGMRALRPELVPSVPTAILVQR